MTEPVLDAIFVAANAIWPVVFLRAGGRRAVVVLYGGAVAVYFAWVAWDLRHGWRGLGVVVAELVGSALVGVLIGIAVHVALLRRRRRAPRR